MPRWRVPATLFAAFAVGTYGKASLSELQREFDAGGARERNRFFNGASTVLRKMLAIKDTTEKQQLLGFACLSEKDYSCCGTAMAQASNKLAKQSAKKKKKLADILRSISGFCKTVAEAMASKEWPSAKSLMLDAMAMGRPQLGNEAFDKDLGGQDMGNMFKGALYEINAKIGGGDMMEMPPNMISGGGAGFYIPGLTANPFYDSSVIRAAKVAEDNYDVIGPEVRAWLQETQVAGSEASKRWVKRKEVENDLKTQGSWNEVPLFNHGLRQELCDFLPKTCQVIDEKIPEVWSNGNGLCSISVLEPGTEVRMHQGKTNSVLTMQLAVSAAKSAGISCGGVEKHPGWQAGKATVFDDSFNHAVWHRGAAEEGLRAVVLCRIIHPDFSLSERHGFLRDKYVSIMKSSANEKVNITEADLKRRVDYLQSAEAAALWKETSRIFRAGTSTRPGSREEL